MSTLDLRARVSFVLAGLGLALAVQSCSTPKVDLAAWRSRVSIARAPDQRADLEQELADVARARAADDLAAARMLALKLVAEQPDDARVLVAASRAESDGVFLYDESDKDSRNHAAANSLAYAERARELGDTSVDGRAQLAWALGTTTHLQSMSERSAHAARTKAEAEAVLRLAPDPTALATMAVLNLRLQTLPWIAELMASGLPESSLADAERYARQAVVGRPSRENRHILAKVLVEVGKRDEAISVLRLALETPPGFPRDHALEQPIRALLDGLDKQ